MVNDALSSIVLIVAVRQLLINIVVIDKGGNINLFATPVINSRSATARLLLLVFYRIDHVHS